jgi:hypothetical protein
MLLGVNTGRMVTTVPCTPTVWPLKYCAPTPSNRQHNHAEADPAMAIQAAPRKTQTTGRSRLRWNDRSSLSVSRLTPNEPRPATAAPNRPIATMTVRETGWDHV